MQDLTGNEPVPGFVAPVHRALTEPILMGGAPRAVAILNGTLAAALGLGLRLWIAGLLLWVIGHAAAVWAARRRRSSSSGRRATASSSIIAYARTTTSSTACSAPPNCASAASTSRPFASPARMGDHK